MPGDKDKKSFKKQKAEATHEFFNKTNTGGSKAGAGSFTFNKAPLNKDMAKKELSKAKEEGRAVAGMPGKRQRSTFMAKLYKDEDDLNELKMMAGDDNFDSDIESKDADEEGQEKKREIKLRTKSEAKGLKAISGQGTSSIKIPKLVS